MPGTWHGLWGWRRRLPVERRVGRHGVLGGLTLCVQLSDALRLREGTGVWHRATCRLSEC